MKEITVHLIAIALGVALGAAYLGAAPPMNEQGGNGPPGAPAERQMGSEAPQRAPQYQPGQHREQNNQHHKNNAPMHGQHSKPPRPNQQ